MVPKRHCHQTSRDRPADLFCILIVLGGTVSFCFAFPPWVWPLQTGSGYFCSTGYLASLSTASHPIELSPPSPPPWLQIQDPKQTQIRGPPKKLIYAWQAQTQKVIRTVEKQQINKQQTDTIKKPLTKDIKKIMRTAGPTHLTFVSYKSCWIWDFHNNDWYCYDVAYKDMQHHVYVKRLILCNEAIRHECKWRKCYKMKPFYQ